jgi:AraC-like DNA-binding protein
MTLFNPINATPDTQLSPILLNVGIERMDGSLSFACKLTRTKILLVEEAEGWYDLDYRRVAAAPGDLLVVPPQSVFDLGNIQNAKGWIVDFDSPVLRGANLFSLSPKVATFFDSMDRRVQHFQVNPINYLRWKNRLVYLENEFKEQSSEFTEVAHNLLLLCLIDIARMTPVSSVLPVSISVPQVQKGSSQAELLLDKIFHFIRTNYHRQISLCDVAKSLGRSPSYLTDLVRRETGQTVLNWIIQYRLREARRLLVQTDHPIQKIAEAIGYLDTGHFIRQFNREMGKTPQAWRRIHQSSKAMRGSDGFL